MPVNIDVVPESTYTTERPPFARRLWLGLLAGPLLYAFYFVVGYLLAEATCTQNLFAIGTAGLAPAIGILTGMISLLTVIFAALSYRHWRQFHGRDDAVGGALAFMAFGGLLLNGLFTLFVVVTGVAVFFIDTCRWI